MATKDWVKIISDKDYIVWENNNKSIQLKVYKTSWYTGGDWDISLYYLLPKRRNIIYQSISKKIDAIRIAKSYMRSH